MQKTLTEVAQYFERIYVLGTTDKMSEHQKSGKDRPENETKSRPKIHKGGVPVLAITYWSKYIPGCFF